MQADRTLFSCALLAALLAGVIPAAAQQATPAPPPPPPPPEAPGTESEERIITGDYTVDAGETVADIVVVGGDLRVLGRVTGDPVVVGGNLVLEESGSILGDALVTGGEFVNEGGLFSGEIRTVDGIAGAAARRGAARARDAAADVDVNVAAEVDREVRRRVHHGSSSWFTPIQKGFAGVISTLALGLVLAGIGAAVIFYGRPYLETVSDTVRGSTLRSGAVGLAAGFLVFPAFVVLVVALAVTIVGIPLLLLAVPLYPLAVVAAVGFGLLASAHAVGERTS